jgi:serine/threonine protein kinase
MSSPKISLNQYYISHKKTFSIKRACELVLGIIDSIEILHNHNIIHRDIKPQVLGIALKGKKTEIMSFLDFGFWKYYKNKKGHIPYKQYKKMIGKNIIFGSINALNRIELSRRDDLESLSYILIYFIKGCLPWENIVNKNKEEKINIILDYKKRISDDTLCEGLPEEIKLFVSYTKNLKFEEEPDYNYLKNLLKVIINTKNTDKDYYFDLSKKNNIP